MKLTLALTAGAIALAGPAFSQSLQDLYGFVFGGITLEGSSDFDGTVSGAPQSVDTEFDTGGQFGFGVGATLAPNVRGEIELSYSQQDADEVFFSGNGPAAEVNVGGGLRSTALFANAYYDFDTGGAFTPFVGAGLGVAFVEQDLVYGPGVRLSDDDTVLGAQLIAGGSYDLSDSLALTADVRYRRLFDIETNRNAPTGASTGLISGDYDDLSVNVGLRFRF